MSQASKPNNRARLKPASPELVVRDPITRQALPADGELVDLSDYWHRRLAEGDVVLVTAAKAASKTVQGTAQ